MEEEEKKEEEEEGEIAEAESKFVGSVSLEVLEEALNWLQERRRRRWEEWKRRSEERRLEEEEELRHMDVR